MSRLAKYRPRELAFWLFVLDLLAHARLIGTRPYLWVVGRAALCCAWLPDGEPADERDLVAPW